MVPVSKILGTTVLFSLALFAQQRSAPDTRPVMVSGRIFDPNDALIPGVMVDLHAVGSEHHYGTLTNEQGRFLVRVPADRYSLVVAHAGFKAVSKRLGETRPGDTIEVGDIVLDVDPLCCTGDTIPDDPVQFYMPLARTIETNVCEIAEHPDRFRDANLILRANISTYVLDAVPRLYDQSCRNRELSFGPANESLLHDWSYRRLEEYLREHRPMNVTLRGKLDFSLALGSGPVNIFRIEEIFDLTAGQPVMRVTRKKRKK